MTGISTSLKLLPISLFCLAVCLAPARAAEPLKVYTVNYPLQYMAQRIGGGTVQAVFPVPADVDPAFWQPRAEVVMAYQKADLIILNGARYAKWAAQATLPRFRMMDSLACCPQRLIRMEGVKTHSHGGGPEHSHGGIAFTTWLDLDLAARQAEAICQALIKKIPAHEAEYHRNLEALLADLAGLDRELRALSPQKPAAPLIASHPVYQYLAARYSLNIRSLHWEPGQEPSPAQWDELKALHKNYPAGWMLWEGSPLPQVAEKLRAMGIESLLFDPCAQPPEKGDFLSVMGENVRRLGKAFE